MKKVLFLLVLGISISTIPAYSQQQGDFYHEYMKMQDLYSDLQNQLSSAVDEINRLQMENYNLKNNSQGQLTGAAASVQDNSVVRKLQSQLSQKNHEAQKLRQQLQIANSNLAQLRTQRQGYNSSGRCSNCTKKKRNFFKRVFKRRS